MIEIKVMSGVYEMFTISLSKKEFSEIYSLGDTVNLKSFNIRKFTYNCGLDKYKASTEKLIYK